MKKHIRSEDHVGWTIAYPLFTQASDAELEAVKKGAEHFHSAHPDAKLFPDPFLPPHRFPSPSRLDRLVIVHGPDPLSRAGADRAAAAVKERYGIEPAVRSVDAASRAALAESAPLLLAGGAEINPVSLELAKKYQVGVFDGSVPGPGGWGVTVYPELDAGQPPRYVLAYDESTLDSAVKAWLDQAIADEATPTLQWAHAVSPGRGWSEKSLDFDRWLAGRAKSAFAFEEVRDWVNSGFKRPYREIFTDVLLRDFSDGVISNGMMVDLGVDAIRFYQRTGDRRGLELFREMLSGFWNYLNSDNPSVYISDLDFRAGAVCRYWNWIASHPDITDEERAWVPKLLLGMMRMVRDYFLHRWKYRRADTPEIVRHNHQTFPALTLAHAARYVRRWPLPEANTWDEDAAYIFEAIDPTQFKYSENAYSYEVFVPKHFLAWLETVDRPLPPAFRDALCRFAKRQWIMLDNFHLPVDYGDTHVHMAPTRPFIVGPWLLPGQPEHRDVLDRETAHTQVFSPRDPSAHEPFTGLLPRVCSGQLPRERGWARMPIDPDFARRAVFQGPAERQFDKLAWRSGWGEDALYVAVEGIGATGISHGHHEANGILRLNMGGRLWWVSNGYGKRIGLKAAGRAFSTRQLGPEDHNMLVIGAADASGPVIPPVNALELDRAETPVACCISELPGYAGCLWRRHLFLLEPVGAVVIDRLIPGKGDVLPESVHLEWNILGAPSPEPWGARVEQSGKVAEFHTFGADCRWGENGSATWDEILRSGAYAHAGVPLRKAVLTPASSGEPDLIMVTGLWLEGAVRHAEWSADARRLELEFAEADRARDGVREQVWGTVQRAGARLTVVLGDAVTS